MSQLENHQPPALETIWSSVVEAVRGSEQDFTEGGLGRAIILLSIPMVLEMVLESVFAVVDVFFVARLGADAVATVGVTESLVTLVYAVAIGISMGTTAMVSRRIGEKRPRDAAVAAVQAVTLGVVVSIPVSVIGIAFGADLLRLMGMTPAVAQANASFTSVLLGGNAVIMTIFIFNAVFRGAGDAAVAMRALWIANGLNIVLDPCLIFGWGPFPELGITGAAVATTIGRSVGVAYQIRCIARGRSRIRIERDDLRPRPALIARLARISAGGVGQFFIAVASWIGVMRIMAVFGSESLAGYTIAIRICMFTILPSWGMANAAATLVGQNLGAGEPERAERSVWMSARANMIFLGMVGLVFIIEPGVFAGLFTDNAKILAIAGDCLRILGFGYILYALGMVVVQAFNGAGDTVTPTWINFICFWVVELPLAYALALPAGFDERGVFLAIVFAETLMSLMGAVVFRRGRWKLRTV